MMAFYDSSRLPLLVTLLITIFATNCQAAIDVNISSRSARSNRKARKHNLIPRGGSSLPSWSNKIIAGGTSRALAQALLYPVDGELAHDIIKKWALKCDINLTLDYILDICITHISFKLC